MDSQWRAGAMGIIGLDYPAVYQEAARLQIEPTICTMKKIKALERHMLKKMMDADSDKKQKKLDKFRSMNEKM